MTDFDEMGEDVFMDKKPSKRAKAYKDLDDSQYRKCKLREEIISMSYSSTEEFGAFLEENSDRIPRAGFDLQTLETLGRTIRNNRKTINTSTEESLLIDEIFGVYRRAYPMGEEHCCIPRKEKVRTPLQEVQYIKDCTYEHFFQWMMIDGLDRIASNLDEDGWVMVSNAVDEAIMKDIGLPNQRHYMAGDENLFSGRMQELMI